MLLQIAFPIIVAFWVQDVVMGAKKYTQLEKEESGSRV